jgi:hypothetical protein
MKTSLRRNLLFFVALTLLGLNACSPGATATPTESLEAVYTRAAQTLTAQAGQPTSTPALTATAQGTPTPFVTATKTPDSLPTLGASSPTPLPQNTCDNAAYVSDVTIPDHSVLVPGESFVKTWALQNTGTCTWTPTYAINYVSGDQMSGAATAIGQSVAPGQKANISITLLAPKTPGEYTGYWRLNNDKGTRFGEAFYVIINVSVGVTSTTTLTPAATSGFTATPTRTTSAPAATPTRTTAAPAATPTPTPTAAPTGTPTHIPLTPTPTAT